MSPQRCAFALAILASLLILSRLPARTVNAATYVVNSADDTNDGTCDVAHCSLREAINAANQIGDDPNRGGLSRRWVMQAAEESLKRLGTDHIDIYYLHKEDHATPLQETVRAMGDLIRQGKIRYFGVSNYRAWRVAEICNICDDNGIDRPVVSQPYYNAMNRMPEVEHFPACGYYGLGIVPYSPLARGVLTGKYAPDAAPGKDTRAGRADKRMMQTEWRPESLKLAQQIKQHAESRGITAGQFAVAWVLNSAFVTGVIAGRQTPGGLCDGVGGQHLTRRRHLRLHHDALQDAGGVDVLVFQGLRDTVFHGPEESVGIFEGVGQRLQCVILGELGRGSAIGVGPAQGRQLVVQAVVLQVAEHPATDHRSDKQGSNPAPRGLRAPAKLS